jgi:hypothetical protein
MGIELDMIEERDQRIAAMSAEFRAAQQRRLIKRSIASRNRSEAPLRPAAVAITVQPPRES